MSTEIGIGKMEAYGQLEENTHEEDGEGRSVLTEGSIG